MLASDGPQLSVTFQAAALSETGTRDGKSGDLAISDRGRGLTRLRGRWCTTDRFADWLSDPSPGTAGAAADWGGGVVTGHDRRERHQRGRDELDQKQQPEPVRQRRAAGETVDEPGRSGARDGNDSPRCSGLLATRNPWQAPRTVRLTPRDLVAVVSRAGHFGSRVRAEELSKGLAVLRTRASSD